MGNASMAGPEVGLGTHLSSLYWHGRGEQISAGLCHQSFTLKMPENALFAA